ncbi:hypothetical protein HEB94_002844 [Actinopolymorpha pittospori]|uniref:Uncharacterized protein n=1 Tax=Actinopolymorpha pittospori TaxID=648752 RepID=A0A927MTE9_9ACTN|nr:hypothetical protein [Actinopolymorpha pittospori]
MALPSRVWSRGWPVEARHAVHPASRNSSSRNK